MDRLVNSTIGSECKLNSWYLHVLAVHPDHQRKGIGRKLVQIGEALARQDGTSVVLETTTRVNASIYQKLGFDIRGESKITSPFGECPLLLLTKEF